MGFRPDVNTRRGGVNEHFFLSKWIGILVGDVIAAFFYSGRIFSCMVFFVKT